MVLWLLTDSLECWAQLDGNNPIFFDTSHATNRYALKFAAFTTIDKHGKSQILACSLIARETTDSFVWIFTQFLQAFRQCPRVIITDGDPAMAAAITQIYPSAIHLLCTFHLGQNIVSHIKPLFNGRNENSRENWNTLLHCWWKTCKKQDYYSRDNFDEEWKHLLSLIDLRKNVTNEKTYNSAQKFMKSLYDKRQQWAARWTWQHLTLGAHSTQRSESVHSCIKQFLNSHTLLTQLATKIDENRQTTSCQNEGRATRLALKLGYDSSTRHSIEKNLKITPFSLAIVRAQIAQCLQYSMESLPTEEYHDSVYEVRYTLTCQKYLYTTKYPCTDCAIYTTKESVGNQDGN